ncbi:dephospho-CoA kinase [Marinirhabdus gelatinilytica]|uniref:Dephospho-CoA kinase n=1 Tax=Marinirhabdus gelatinilytica TaxID=1703343 RepID=A0A370QFR1_9FLAO|nr:dephospho-CoA kinase [Marinirhabdus gelatinilytica]RDK86870.1 dephospho-CoA kinase [Marinirhabdus gelatinilytica]
MKIIGLTGGIGSGKTTVAKMFKNNGVPVYIADVEAKLLTNRSKYIKKKVIALLGEKAYREGHLDRKFVANIVFNDTEKLKALNAIIHPRVAQHFSRWIKKQNAPYCIKEAAILFENGGYKQCDQTILVVADRAVRIQRVLQRDNTTVEEIEARMSNQWDDDKKKELADYIIKNTTLEETQKQVDAIHAKLSKSQ